MKKVKKAITRVNSTFFSLVSQSKAKVFSYICGWSFGYLMDNANKFLLRYGIFFCVFVGFWGDEMRRNDETGFSNRDGFE